MSSISTELTMVDDEKTCRDVWPGQAVFYPNGTPWIPYSNDMYHCQQLNGVCIRKLTAQRVESGTGRSRPDFARVYGLCEQMAYTTGYPPFKEDGGRRLFPLRPGDRVLTQTAGIIEARGSAINVDWYSNSARGACYYRVPDPFGLWGGPRSTDMPPPWNLNQSNVFRAPGIELLGWPPEFWSSLPNSYQLPLDISANQISATLRATLAAHGVQITSIAKRMKLLDQWVEADSAITCESDLEMSLSKNNGLWRAASLDTERSCVIRYCNMDPTIRDSRDTTRCAGIAGCTKQCAYCLSPATRTQESGICYTELESEVARCTQLGGYRVDGFVFDEKQGINRNTSMCLMPHRPVVFCTRPGEQVKRCAHFDVEHCDGDPVAQALGCSVGLRRCQTKLECSSAGTCSDEAVGLSWAETGTCVVTPYNDAKVEEECDSQGLCYLHIDPPFGMEVRRKHGLLDLLGPDTENSSQWGSILDIQSVNALEERNDRLRSDGRLNRTECESLEVGPGHRPLWLQRARKAEECTRLHGCCLLFRGVQCEIFSGPAIYITPDGGPDLVRQHQEDCRKCGGVWTPVFHWEQAVWQQGQMVQPNREWKSRSWNSANDWTDVVDMDAMRQLFENAQQLRIGQQRQNAVKCMVEPLLAALENFASACGAAPNGMVKDPGASLSSMPMPTVDVGQVVSLRGTPGRAQFGAVGLSWHEHSAGFPADKNPFVSYQVSLVAAEYFFAMGAPQIALPMRAEYTRQRLMTFSLAPSTSTTQPPLREQLEVGNRDGYPSWMVNDMIKFMNPELIQAQQTAAALLIQDEELARKYREQERQQRAAAADAFSGLPAASRRVILKEAPPVTPTSPPEAVHDALGIDDGPCRNIIINRGGEIVGQILGDCVRLDVSVPLLNSVEMCLPVTFNTTELNNTDLAQAHGLALDFARRDVVPDVYKTQTPVPVSGGGQVPGKLAPAMWEWQSDPQFGRLVPGWSWFTPLLLEAEFRNQNTQLCAKVYEAGVTYCPIARINTSFYTMLPPPPPGTTRAPLDSACPRLDAILSGIYRVQASNLQQVSQYIPHDMQVSDEDLSQKQNERLKRMRASNSCSPGTCLELQGRGFYPSDSQSCTVVC